jgi:hypothetical protein
VDARLAGWRDDPARRAATDAARTALARWWATEGPLAPLNRALDAIAAPRAVEVARLVRPYLEDARWLDEAIATFAAHVRADPLLDPPLVPIANAAHEGLLLFRHRHAAIFAGVGARDRLAAKRMRPRGGAIVVPGQLGLVRVLRGGGATLSFWRGGWRGATPMPACAAAGTRRLRDGELLAIDGRRTGFVVEHAHSDIVLLQATIFADPAPTLCEYDALDLRLCATGAAREEASRAQMLVTLLAELDMPEVDAFDIASRAPEPFARWHAMRAWVSLDAGGAARRLAEMAARDPDVELRALAARTLAMIEPCRD